MASILVQFTVGRNRGITMLIGRVIVICAIVVLMHAPAWGQTVSGARALGGGVGPLFSLVGPGNLYLDNQGTQGYMYSVNTFESFNFRNPTTGQAWSGAVMTLGPQLSVGIIQGALQGVGTPVVLIPPPSQAGPPLVSGFSLMAIAGPGQPSTIATGLLPTVPSLPVTAANVTGATVQPVGLPPTLLLQQPLTVPFATPHELESSLLEIP